jgi:alkanesulfonate monooxygenase SsuD/methylene tetrahydromethanopterin reductase-like flavin-dependent oxidoreductase (luciferase family)
MADRAEPTAATATAPDAVPARRPLKVGLALPVFTNDPARTLDIARDAESLGFDGVFGSDHLLPVGGPRDGPALECFTTLAAVGAVTSRIAVGALVTRAGIRPAGMIAKLAANLDLITEGRAVLGLGTGDRLSEAEHHTFGFPIESPEVRTERLAETAEAVRSLLSGVGYAGGRLLPPFDGPILPAPLRQGGPPLWIGGTSDRVVGVAARLADAWNGWRLSIESFSEKVRLLDDLSSANATPHRVEATWGGIALIGDDDADAERRTAERAAQGREAPAFAGSADRAVEWLVSLRDAGATWAVLLLAGPPDRRTLVAEHVLPQLALD